jgi:pyruvate-formate lyase
VCEQTRAQAPRVGLASYLVVVINNSANTLMGAHTAASADGRQDGTPMANGNAPTSGADAAGLTARLNSVVRPSPAIHDGAVQNLALSRELVTEHRDAVEALLEVYFARGGAQLMITVTGRGELEAALAHPEQYRHVFVRVGGFSARFVDLPPGVQREILERTLY